MPQAYRRAPFQIDHIIARQHLGETGEANLALACFRCNKFKGPNIAGIDPETGVLTRLFHPRNDVWSEHFEWLGPQLRGKSDIGRVTVQVLGMNHEAAVEARRALMDENVFFSTEDHWKH